MKAKFFAATWFGAVLLRSKITGGTLTVFQEGTFIYILPLDYLGDDSFTYTIFDGITTASGTITIHVS